MAGEDGSLDVRLNEFAVRCFCDNADTHLTVREMAALYIRLGWRVVPLDPGTKGTHEVNWPELIHTPADFRDNDNIGIQSVDGLVVIDLDCDEAVALAGKILPPTGTVYGRPSRLRSKWIYRSSFEKKVTYSDPHTSKHIVQIRVDGRDMAPPSIHPNGERLAWDSLTEPAEVESAELRGRVRLIATATMVSRCYAAKHARHDYTLALSGTLKRLKIPLDDAIVVLTHASRLAGDPKLDDRLLEVRSTYERADQPITSLKALKQCTQSHPLFVQSLVAIWKPARDATPVTVTTEDFYAYMPTHRYLFMPSNEFWPAESVNARLPRIEVGMDDDGKSVTLTASAWLDRNRHVEQATWAPGEPRIIEGRLVADGAWLHRDDCACVNLYRPGTVPLGDPSPAGMWVELIRKVYSDDADHLIVWFAHPPSKCSTNQDGAPSVDRPITVHGTPRPSWMAYPRPEGLLVGMGRSGSSPTGGLPEWTREVPGEVRAAGAGKAA